VLLALIHSLSARRQSAAENPVFHFYRLSLGTSLENLRLRACMYILYAVQLFLVTLSYSVSSFVLYIGKCDRLCGLVVRVLGYRSGGLGSIPCTTRKKSNGSGTGFTQLLDKKVAAPVQNREYGRRDPSR
jgi:hypothetical protein